MIMSKDVLLMLKKSRGKVQDQLPREKPLKWSLKDVLDFSDVKR